MTWIKVDPSSDFSIHNIPFGIFSGPHGRKRIGTRLGDIVLDLEGIADLGIFSSLEIDPDIFESTELNPFIGLGKSSTNGIRSIIQTHLRDENSIIREHPKLLFDAENVTMHLPVDIKDYTDFYSSYNHAYNVGVMFRDPENAIMPNWRHLPVGYHGRASSIIPSGIKINRPNGQLKPADSSPIYGPSRRLDFELEMAFIIGQKKSLGTRISTGDAEDYIFGMVLFNDWSARDIQKWEYVPLGPFLGKSFASSISPWVVTLEALDFVRIPGPAQEPEVLPYLQCLRNHHFDIELSVGLQPENNDETIICKSNYRHMYWNMAQQVAHHTVNGCNLNIGDMMASGTISGTEESSYGSMLELSWAGQKIVELNDGTTRKFIEDYDTVSLYGHAVRGDRRVGFGKVENQILPAL